MKRVSGFVRDGERKRRPEASKERRRQEEAMEPILTADPSHPAIIMAFSGETITHGELEARANRIAHLLRAAGLKRGDHFAVFMENHPRYIECGFAGERAGLYYTNVNSYLTADELAYIVNNSLSQVLIASRSHLAVAREALRNCDRVKLCLVVDGPSESETVRNLDEAAAAFPDTPIADESRGWAMLYSSGTTGRPKGILRPLVDTPAREMTSLGAVLAKFWDVRKGETCLVPAPLYHSAPWAEAGLTVNLNGTAVVMERFDEEAVLRAIEKYRVTHAQFVPTMFSRMLKLPPEVRARYDLSTLRYVLHGAAPCSIPVKQAMIDWLGPIVHEYYAATEGFGLAMCDSAQWLEHKGTVGKAVFGEAHVLDAEMREVPRGTVGKLWFKTAHPFEYFNDPEKTAAANSPDRVMSTVGDVGCIDEEGFIYLTDRESFMIISGGVNIYPQECENLLITHPKVRDAAVFGAPNEEMGEEVKAVVQLMPGAAPGVETEAELIAFCRQHLAHMKCPRSIDFEEEFPRLPTGKLYKTALRDRYWKGHASRIL
jgi:long-chain acyl-CoA synthetase